MRIQTALKLMRAAKDVGLREQAREIGISAATLSRIENGHDCDARSMAKLMLWLIGSEEGEA